MKDQFYLILYHLFRWGVIRIPEPILAPLLKQLSRIACILDRRHRHIARVNLDLAFGETIPSREKNRIIRKSYENLAFLLARFIQHQGISKEEILDKITIVNREIFDEAKQTGRPLIFITAHYGNWELLSLAVAAAFGPLTIVGRPLDSPALNAILEKNRQQFDIVLLEKSGAMKGMLSALKKGRNVGLLVDQNTSNRDGILVDFFGKEARHTPAAAILARGMNALVIPMFIETEDHRHYTLRLYPPIDIEKSEDKEADILCHTQAQADITEQVIRQKPDEWFWLHQRWKNQYEELYRGR